MSKHEIDLPEFKFLINFQVKVSGEKYFAADRHSSHLHLHLRRQIKQQFIKLLSYNLIKRLTLNRTMIYSLYQQSNLHRENISDTPVVKYYIEN